MSTRTAELRWTVDGLEKLRSFRGSVTIGRDEGADVTLESPRVSRVHARLLLEEEGCRLENLSPNGTRIGGEKITKSRLLDSDTVIEIADFRLSLRLGSPPTGSEEEPLREPPRLSPAAERVVFGWAMTLWVGAAIVVLAFLYSVYRSLAT